MRQWMWSTGLLGLMLGCGGVVDDADEGAVRSAAKADQSWVTRLGGSRSTCSPRLDYLCFDDARVMALHVRSNGSLVVAGAFAGRVQAGAQTLESHFAQANYPPDWPISDVFVAEVDATGDISWAVPFGGRDNDWIYGIAEDDIGNIFVTGTFALPLTLGATTLTTRGSVDVFVAKLSPQGQPLWATSAGSPTYDYSQGLVLRGSSVFVAGAVSGSAQFGAVATQGSGLSDGFLAELRQSDGTWLAAKAFGGPGPDAARAIALDEHDDVLVGGYIGEDASVLGLPASVQGNRSAFLVGVSPGLLATELLTATGTGDSSVEAIAVSSNGHIAVGGWYTGGFGLGSLVGSTGTDFDGFLARLDDWQVAEGYTLSGPDDCTVHGVAIEPSRRMYAVGSFTGAVTFNGRTLLSAGASDALAVGTHDGKTSLLARAGGTLDDGARAVAALSNHSVWVGGRVRGAADFEGTPTSGSGFADAFVWRLRGD
ncbi:MAG: hypothetical protein R3B13_23090 [Polyangiaceae bacterium]